MPDRPLLQSGNIFFALFGAVALVGVIGASANTILRGPVRTMQTVTQKSIAENQMIAAGRLAIMAAITQEGGGDCDADGTIEPVPFSSGGLGPFPIGGGSLPNTIGSSKKDPWGNPYGYCVWDHGEMIEALGCGEGRLRGAEDGVGIVLAVISSGPDRLFQTSCADHPDYVVRAAGDDIVLEYTYDEAVGLGGGLWTIKGSDPDTAEIGARNIEVAGSGGSGTARIGYDAGLDIAGVGDFLAVKTDGLYSHTPDTEIIAQSPLRIQAISGMDSPSQPVCTGEGWTSIAAPEANGWRSLTYGGGKFVALATDGTNRIMTSPDGVNWTARAAPELNTWSSVTYGNGLFVAVSRDGMNRIMTSPDGENWTAHAALVANWNSVTYGGGKFVAVAISGGQPNLIMTSPDGESWTARSAPLNAWGSVTYGNGLFVAVASNGINRIITSPDGVNWTERAAPELNTWSSVTYGNGLFVAVSRDGINRIMTSPDGENWTARAAPDARWNSVTYGNGLFVAVTYYSATNQIMTSPDGENWTARAAPHQGAWYDVTYGGGKFVAVAYNGTNRIMVSTCE